MNQFYVEHISDSLPDRISIDNFLYSNSKGTKVVRLVSHSHNYDVVLKVHGVEILSRCFAHDIASAMAFFGQICAGI